MVPQGTGRKRVELFGKTGENARGAERGRYGVRRNAPDRGHRAGTN